MAEENVGCALCLDHIIPKYKNSPLCFRPLESQIEAGLDIVWKKYQVFTKPAALFLNMLQEEIKMQTLITISISSVFARIVK